MTKKYGGQNGIVTLKKKKKQNKMTDNNFHSTFLLVTDK